MAEQNRTESIQEEANSGAILTNFGALAAIELFAIILIVGNQSTSSAILNSLIYAIGVSILTIFTASLAIDKSRKGKR